MANPESSVSTCGPMIREYNGVEEAAPAQKIVIGFDNWNSVRHGKLAEFKILEAAVYCHS